MDRHEPSYLLERSFSAKNSTNNQGSSTLRLDVPEPFNKSDNLELLDSPVPTQESAKLSSLKRKSKISETFKKQLLSNRDSAGLSETFAKTARPLRKSDANNLNFSFRACKDRLIRGYYLLLFSYNTALPSKVCLAADGYGILIKPQKQQEKRIGYDCFRGIILGDKSMTFSWFKSKGKKLQHLGLESTDCFTLLTAFRGYDFATHSDRAKYDIYIVFSFFTSAINSQYFPSILLSKSELTLFKVKTKLREMAHERHLNLKELLLLAVFTTAVNLEIKNQAFFKLKNILDRLLNGSNKIFRISRYFIPEDFSSSKQFVEHFDNIKRSSILSRRMAFQLFEENQAIIKMMGSWSKIKHSSYIYTMETFKQYLKRMKKRVPKSSSKPDIFSPLKYNYS